jgi:hypothetical protein
MLYEKLTMVFDFARLHFCLCQTNEFAETVVHVGASVIDVEG